MLFSASGFGQTLKEIYATEDTAALHQYLSVNDPNECINGTTLLMKFIAGSKKSLVKYLLEYGVEINAVCRKERTSLMYAARHNESEIAGWLIEAGADVMRKDYQGHTAMEMAVEFENPEFIQAVVKKNHRQFVGYDGPYIFFGEKAEINQITPDENNRVVSEVAYLDTEEIYDRSFRCYNEDGKSLFNFSIKKRFLKEEDKYKMPKKLVILSDIEGNFNAFSDLLKSTRVVDENLNWQFGEGHLVLLGDFFDRGNQVTECLWLIYKLEQEAAKTGGKVHFILGNHETMNLEGDLRYVHYKYFANAIEFNKDYNSFFNENTFLGKWLRTKNVAVQIGRTLFVHGGISPQFAVKNIDLPTLNERARKNLGVPLDSLVNDTIAVAIFNPFTGPLWYRGYFEEELTTESVDAILNHLGIKKIVVGHTPVTNIQELHGGRVVSIDVPHALGKKYQQALFIEKGKYYVVVLDGKKELIKVADK